MLLKRRLDEALRLMLADNNDERSLMDIARCCGFGGTSQFSRAFRARFGVPPRQYLALVRQQDLDWHEARLDGRRLRPGCLLMAATGVERIRNNPVGPD